MIWCNIELPEVALEALREGTGDDLTVAKEAPVGATVAFGQPDAEAVLGLRGLEWVQVTTAGYTRYDTETFRARLAQKGAVLCNSSSVYDEPCAQHLLAMMLAFARQLPQSMEEQRGDRAWSSARLRADSWLLQDGRVLLVGYGAIAKRVVELLSPFGVEVVAVRRRVRGDEAVRTYPVEELDRLLPHFDHVANILPANVSTDALFDSARFALMKPGARFYNIGRGTTVDQDDLLAALDRLGGVYLDVTDPEPLPRDHALWSAPKVLITPHTAGGHRGEELRLVRLFLENRRRRASGEPLIDRVM